MKATKIIYWTTTILLFLFEGVMPAFSSQTAEAKKGISQLGYPEYFGLALAIFKVLGSIGLILPFVKGRVKEWVYAGFAFDFIFAFISLAVVFGATPMLAIPAVCLIVLIISYVTYHKLQSSAYEKTTIAKRNTVAFQ